MKAHPYSGSPRYVYKMVLPNMCVFLGQHSLRLVLLTAIALSPATVVALTQEDVCKKDVYPPLWHQAPGSIEDFPVHGNRIIISAWNYLERLGVYKILLNYSAKYFTTSGSNNILWGLPLQLGWQYRTAVNYYLGIIPFLGAMEAGFFGQLQHEIKILPPEELRADFCYSTADCRSHIPKVMDAWKAYFEGNIIVEGSPNFSVVRITSYQRDYLVDILPFMITHLPLAVNYYLGIIPFLGAMEAGFFGQLQHEIKILPPEELRADFCYSTADCRSHIPKVMDAWKAYFEYLLSTEQKSERLTASFFSIEKNEALHYLWKAHVASIAYAVPKFRNRLKYMSGPEASFGENWADAVDFIAAAHFSADLQKTNYFQAFLPPRMLSEHDQAPFISDFSPEQNKVLLSLCVLHKTNELTGGALLLLWRTVMSTEAGRAVIRSLIQNLITGPGVCSSKNK